MTAAMPRRHSLRDINDMLHRLAQQRAEGALALEDYRALRNRLLDAMASPDALDRLVDDADTELLSTAGPAAAARRRHRGGRDRARRLVGVLIIAGVMAWVAAALVYVAGGLP